MNNRLQQPARFFATSWHTCRFIVLLCIVTHGLIACSTISPGCPAPSARRTIAPPIPAYPDMRQHEQRVKKDEGGRDMDVTTFHTSTSPADVLAFYRDRLTQEGWKVTVSNEQGYLMINNEAALPFYALQVRTAVNQAGVTTVELSLSDYHC